MSASALHPDLEQLQREYADTRRRGVDMITRLSSEELNRRPAPDAWSVGECLDHLNVTNEQYAERIQEAMRRGARASVPQTRPFRYGWLEMKFVHSMEPPIRRKYRATRKFQPQAHHDPEELLAHWERVHDTIGRLLRESNGLALDRLKVQSPVMPLLRFHLGAVFHLLAAHERRHLWQAEQNLPPAGPIH